MFGAAGFEKNVKSGKALLGLMDAGLSERAKKDVRNMCAYYKTPLIELEPPGALGVCTGRANNKLAAVLRQSFAARLLEIEKEQAL